MTRRDLLPAVFGAVVGAVFIAVPAVAVVLTDDPEPEPDTPAPQVTYLDCGPGGAHIWLTGDGGIAVVPAGGDCAEGTP